MKQSWTQRVGNHKPFFTYVTFERCEAQHNSPGFSFVSSPCALQDTWLLNAGSRRMFSLCPVGGAAPPVENHWASDRIPDKIESLHNFYWWWHITGYYIMDKEVFVSPLVAVSMLPILKTDLSYIILWELLVYKKILILWDRKTKNNSLILSS